MNENGDPLAQARSDPRVLYAAERTLLAWIRTGLSLMGFGFVVARFGLFLRELAAARGDHATRGPHMSLYIGVALVVMGVVVHILSALRHRSIVKRLALTHGGDRAWSLGIVWLSVILAGMGGGLAAYLLMNP